MKRLKYSLLLWISLIGIFLSSKAYPSEPDIVEPTEYFLMLGDDAKYANPGTDRRLWTHYEYNGMPLHDAVFWVQYDVQIEHTPNRSLGLLISLYGAYEIYWDGKFIEANGVVGIDRQSEVPGEIDKIMLIPLALSQKGKHTVSLRISSQHRQGNQLRGSFASFVTDYDYLVRIPYIQASRPMVMSGALLLVALYTLFVYFTALRQPSYLIFSCLCVVILSLIVTESWRGMWGYTYDWQIPRLVLVLGLSTAIGTLLVLFFCWFFEFSRRNKVMWVTGVLVMQVSILLLANGYDNRSLYVFLVGVLGASIICLQAWHQKRHYAPLMLLGLLLFLAPIFVNIYAYMDQYFFVSFSGLMTLMLYTLAKAMGTKQKQLVRSQITASRLELELVKRQLQPHFILNTLTAIEEWIEESPATAVKFIQALADEFRYMADISSRQLITMQGEINLCRSHLAVMSYRTNVEFTLTAELKQANLPIPPGVLLTFLENAISHNHYTQGDIVFELMQLVTNDKEQEILLKVPITPRLGKNQDETGIRLGIGSQYINARMRESFGSDWRMSSSLGTAYWQVVIVIPMQVKQHLEIKGAVVL